MRQKLVAFGDDYWIENAEGSRVYFADDKAYRLVAAPTDMISLFALIGTYIFETL